ncbi:MAG TPA: type II toxin-antitoxin system Phd/YefM family antitoxin [Planctomycetota bacterium]|nr:type II toxin-antitoxin system Phd/YefM family antitoxin [Planctomycetota bacterium]
MRTVNIHEAKTHLSRLLEEVSQGAEIIIAKAGKPVARLVPVTPSPSRRKLGWLVGRLSVPEEFDAPLPEEVIAAFEGQVDEAPD